jgi:hypothetical protein
MQIITKIQWTFIGKEEQLLLYTDEAFKKILHQKKILLKQRI